MQVHLEQEWLQLFDHTQRSCHFECGRLNCLETWQYWCLELVLLWIHNTVPRDRCHLHFECSSNSWRVTVRFSSPYCNHPLQRCYTPGYDKKKKPTGMVNVIWYLFRYGKSVASPVLNTIFGNVRCHLVLVFIIELLRQGERMVEQLDHTSLSCYPNIPRASVTRYTRAKDGPILYCFHKLRPAMSRAQIPQLSQWLILFLRWLCRTRLPEFWVILGIIVVYLETEYVDPLFSWVGSAERTANTNL